LYRNRFLASAQRERRRRRENSNITSNQTAGHTSAGFENYDLRSELLQAISDAGYAEPRPIQAQTLPPALAGRDVLGLAQTGTGKTAAFVLPILQRLLASRQRGPRALVVTPTRELASQVHAEFVSLAEHTPLTSTVVFGGVPIARQVRALRQNPDIVVACPGRLLDLMSNGHVRLDKVEVLVLDEADHMFDMGFLPDLRRILKALPARRQNLLFSATMPPMIRKLADNVLKKPAVVELANARPADTIEHALCPVAEAEKFGALERLLSGDDFRSAIVFLRTKRRAKQLAQKLSQRKQSAVALQGNMSQGQRQRALAGFREGRFEILVATDIAARGLDIAGVSHVVNFDVPNTPDAYTHRIGRTGRSEQTGKAFTFVTGADTSALRAIEKRLGSKIPRQQIGKAGGGKREETTSLDRPGKSKPKSRSRSQRQGQGQGQRQARSTSAQPARSRPAPAPASVAVAPKAQPVVRDKPAFGVGVLDAPPIKPTTARRTRGRSTQRKSR
jgi:ATP-dependent RNA helicase RhlE